MEKSLEFEMEESKKASSKAIKQKNEARAELTKAERSLAKTVAEICRKSAVVEKRKKRLELCWEEVHRTVLAKCGAPEGDPTSDDALSEIL